MINDKIQLIAEVKTSSPFGWQSKKSWDELFQLANEFGDVISVHTDPRWGGSLELIAKARVQTDKPILAKGLHETDDEIKAAREAGADWVLVVGRVPHEYLDYCWLEPNSLSELKALPPIVKAVWNSRDLLTGDLKLDDFAAARQIFSGWLCQASNLLNVDDVHPLANAVLVGQHLPEFIESLNRR
jgi:hypothetical protein